VLVVCGSDERARGEVQLKDMSVGRQMTDKVADRQDWKAARPGQFNVPRAELVPAVRSCWGRLRPVDEPVCYEIRYELTDAQIRRATRVFLVADGR